jgi:hypothetical protein
MTKMTFSNFEGVFGAPRNPFWIAVSGQSGLTRGATVPENRIFVAFLVTEENEFFEKNSPQISQKHVKKKHKKFPKMRFSACVSFRTVFDGFASRFPFI